MRILISVLFFLVGLVAGFLLDALALHLAGVPGGSSCASCGSPLSLFGPLRCRDCGAKTSLRPYAISLLGGLLYPAADLRFGLSLTLAVDLVLFSCLLALSLVDLEIREIPDLLLLIPALCRLAQLLLESGLTGMLKGLLQSLLPGLLILLLVLLADKLMKKESMGGGDIKLIFLLGLFFPLPRLVLVLALASLFSLLFLLFRKEQKAGEPVPFGPALSAAAALLLLAFG